MSVSPKSALAVVILRYFTTAAHVIVNIGTPHFTLYTNIQFDFRSWPFEGLTDLRQDCP